MPLNEQKGAWNLFLVPAVYSFTAQVRILQKCSWPRWRPCGLRGPAFELSGELEDIPTSGWWLVVEGVLVLAAECAGVC